MEQPALVVLYAYVVTVIPQAMRNIYYLVVVINFEAFAIFGDSNGLGKTIGCTLVVVVFSGKQFCPDKMVRLFGMINSVVLRGHFFNQ